MNFTIQQIKAHDWESNEAHDIIERVKILDFLKTLPLNEFCKILYSMGPESSVYILDIISRFANEK